MPGDLHVIASFATPVEAEILRMRLEAEGIRSVLADEGVVGVNWMLGNAVGGVKVLVSDADLERALEIVDEHASEQSDDREERLSEDWECPACGEKIESGFEICWACGSSREGARDPGFQTEDAEAPEERLRHATDDDDDDHAAKTESTSRADLTGDSANPYRSPAATLEPPRNAEFQPGEEPDTEVGDEIVNRAWRASVIGLVFCPPLLHFYSTWLLLSVAFGDVPLSRNASRRCAMAWVLNLAVSAAAGIGFASFVRYGG